MANLFKTSLLSSVTLLMTLATVGRLSALSAGVKRYCYARDTNPYLKFSCKTAYEVVYNEEGISQIPGCRAVQLWLLSRHGTRFPSLSHFKPMRQLESLRDRILATNRSMLCAEDLKNIARWSFKVPDTEAKHLTNQGRADLVELGGRVVSYFPHLFKFGKSERIVFRHTNTHRTAESAASFAEGVFGTKLAASLPAPPADARSDPLLNPYEQCAAWHALREPKRQDSRFQNSRWMQQVVDRVGRRTGLRLPKLTSAQVFSMYNGCRFQKAWNLDEVSPWCAFFRKEDIEVLEYGEDLMEYYKSGPGSDINIKLACPMLQDMINNFRVVAKCINVVPSRAKSAPKRVTATPKRVQTTHSALLYFSHDWGLQMLLARLNITIEDQPLDADSWPEPASTRRFRTSETVPFAANIMAVLYKCKQGNLKVGIYLQEYLVKVPGCEKNYCDWQKFEQLFGPVADDQACTDMSFCMNRARS